MVSGLEEFGITDDVEETADSAAPSESTTEEEAAAAATPEDPEELRVVLERIPLFAGLLPVHLLRMARLVQRVELSAGEFIFRHGDEGDGLYLVLDGAVRISRNVSGIGEEALAILREGNHFGEMSLIDDDVPRSADAIAHEQTQLLKLPKHDMRDLMFVDRELAYELLWRFVRTLAGRLRDSNDRLMMLSVSSKF